MVIWIIGKSGAGKSTIGKALYELTKPAHPQTCLLDGDRIRDVMLNDLSTSYDDRKKNGERICRLGKLLDEQGFNVITCVLSNYEEQRQWNRDNLSAYFEVYLDVADDVLHTRDQKGLYSGFARGEVKNVVGLDIPFAEPENADLIIKNTGSQSPEQIAMIIYKQICEKFEKTTNHYIYTQTNIQDKKQLYMYSPYYGTSFLKDYMASRRDIFQAFPQETRDLPMLPMIAAYDDKPDGLENDTQRHLVIYLTKISNDSQIEMQELDVFLKKLCRQFEVKRKVLDETEIKIETYVLLSMLTSWYLNHVTYEVRMLNALLKLNDFLIFQYANIPSNYQPLFAYACHMEVMSIQSLHEIEMGVNQDDEK